MGKKEQQKCKDIIKIQGGSGKRIRNSKRKKKLCKKIIDEI